MSDLEFEMSRVQNMSDLEFEMSKSPKVQSNGAVELPIHDFPLRLILDICHVTI